jgi:hypothetical protein
MVCCPPDLELCRSQKAQIPPGGEAKACRYPGGSRSRLQPTRWPRPGARRGALASPTKNLAPSATTETLGTGKWLNRAVLDTSRNRFSATPSDGARPVLRSSTRNRRNLTLMSSGPVNVNKAFQWRLPNRHGVIRGRRAAPPIPLALTSCSPKRGPTPLGVFLDRRTPDALAPSL